MEIGKNQQVEDLVETIMRAMGYNDYDMYNNEELRAKWRKFVRCEEHETVVREQLRGGKSNS